MPTQLVTSRERGLCPCSLRTRDKLAPVSHDTDKLIRQLSLVAFLMAERRPLTARDVKGNVEGYSEMSDEAFARRFYSDRAELIGLGVPLHSQRDEFTGEELYTLRSENYFLDKLELDDDELAALQTALYMLEGTFAYAEPLRLALQNLALGRPGFDDAPTDTASRVQVRDADYSPEMAGRLSKLESAISKQRTIKFSYWSPRRDAVRERSVNPYALRRDRGTWYVVGEDLDNERRTHVPRLADPQRHPLRDPARARLPPPRRLRRRCLPRRRGLAARPSRRHGADRGERRHRLVGAPHAARSRHAHRRRLRDGVRGSRAARRLGAAAERPRHTPRAGGAADRLRRRAPRVRAAHEAEPPKLARVKAIAALADGAERPAPPVAPERFARPPGAARPPARCLRRRPRRAARRGRAAQSASTSPATSCRSTCRCSTSSTSEAAATRSTPSSRATRCASTRSCTETSSGWLPRLTPLEARAIRLALDIVGPSIAAQVHTPLDRVRKKLEETFGQFEDHQAPAVGHGERRGRARRHVFRRDRAAPRRGDRLPEGRRRGAGRAARRAVHVRARAAELADPHAGTASADAERSFRLDRMRSARLTDETFEPREGFDPHFLQDTHQARVRYGEAGRALQRRARRRAAHGRLGSRHPAGRQRATG